MNLQPFHLQIQLPSQLFFHQISLQMLQIIFQLVILLITLRLSLVLIQLITPTFNPTTSPTVSPTKSITIISSPFTVGPNSNVVTSYDGSIIIG
mmetsp:Transcript_15946/g.14426  ORF Transcript_15946/g.14426 Transcript_15946/m.14426 type:complete len:94 (+) Transcript_15946:226-507(+)